MDLRGLKSTELRAMADFFFYNKQMLADLAVVGSSDYNVHAFDAISRIGWHFHDLANKAKKDENSS